MYTVTIEGVDLDLLNEQKNHLVQILAKAEYGPIRLSQNDKHLWGIIHPIDVIEDWACDNTSWVHPVERENA